MDAVQLQKTMLFRGLTDSEIAEALQVLEAHEKRYEKGETLLTAGSVTERMGLVLENPDDIQSRHNYNKYVFFPVQREKWNGSPDAPQNLRTLVASADVLLRAIPASTDKDLFIAGFFENPSDFESVKKDLLEFVTECYNISSKNYYTYLGEQIRLGNSSLMSILDKSQRSVAEKYAYEKYPYCR